MQRLLALTLVAVIFVMAWLGVSGRGERKPKLTTDGVVMAGSTDGMGTVTGEPTRFYSEHLGAEIVVMPGVFKPAEAMTIVLPFMQANAAMFAGKRVLEIGTGSGIISLYAAKLGASRVVSTDIEPAALESNRRNAEALGFAAVVEQRQVPLSDMSAYSVLAADEQFDVIISNPPYSLDLDARGNNAVTDRGDLGFSIIDGLKARLAPDGVVVLLYGSNFYHDVIAKLARYRGYVVESESPQTLTPLEVETLYNFYLSRLLVAQGLPADAFWFDRDRDRLDWLAPLNTTWLFPVDGVRPVLGTLANGAPVRHPGIMVIRRP
jgi:release factor glutamine methyltransferase